MFLTRLAETNRRAFNRLAVLFFSLFLLSIADLLVYTLSESARVFKVVGGREARIGGKLLQPVDRRLLASFEQQSDRSGAPQIDYSRLLAYAPQSSRFAIRITAVQGRLWRGTLRAETSARPVEASFQIFARPGPAPAEAPLYRVHIYPDTASFRRSFRSLSKGFLGIEPLWVPLALLPFALLFFVAAFKAARREERGLQAQGTGPIYKLAKRKDHWEVVFGLGTRHGIQSGQRLQLLDSKWQTVGEIVVETVAEDHSTARLDLSTPVRSDYLVHSNPEAPKDF